MLALFVSCWKSTATAVKCDWRLLRLLTCDITFAANSRRSRYSSCFSSAVSSSAGLCKHRTLFTHLVMSLSDVFTARHSESCNILTYLPHSAIQNALTCCYPRCITTIIDNAWSPRPMCSWLQSPIVFWSVSVFVEIVIQTLNSGCLLK